MRSAHLDAMIKGWFVGDFDPVVLKSKDFEVAVKRYNAGDQEAAHQHRVATEITVVIIGTVRMCGKTWNAGDIVLVEPGETTDFYAVTDAINVVVKSPSVPNDKYIDTV